MSTTYNNAVILNEVPTGFSFYTGIQITNFSNFPINYVASISNTSFDPAVSADYDKDTLFISSSPYDGIGNSDSVIVYPNETGYLYLLHRPTLSPSTGFEKASIQIASNSKNGDDDETITIEVTGQRSTTAPSLSKVGKFYAVQQINQQDNTETFELLFNWSYLSGNSFATRFKIELSPDSGFSSHLAGSPYYYYVPEIEDSFLPVYGNFSGLLGNDFSKLITNLPLNQDIYARIAPVDFNGTVGPYTYATGFLQNFYDNDNLLLDESAYNGDISEPGANLLYVPSVLDLDYLDIGEKGEENINLYEFLVDNNPNRTQPNNFLFYSGINITFNSIDINGRRVNERFGNVAAINLKNPSTDGLKFNTGYGGIFKLNLYFNNTTVDGYNVSDDQSQISDGGPIFNFYNINYKDTNNQIRNFQYHLHIDPSSRLMGGLPKTYGLIIKDSAEADQRVINVDGESIPNQLIDEVTFGNTFIDLSSILGIQVNVQSGDTEQTVEVNYDDIGNLGSLLGNDSLDLVSDIPDVFLDLSTKNLVNANKIVSFDETSITGNYGDTTYFWRGSAGWSLTSLKDGDLADAVGFPVARVDSLTVRGAYGRKCYELERAGAGNRIYRTGIFKKQQYTMNTLPSFSIMIFALAKNSIDADSYQTTVYNILTNGGKIFQFLRYADWLQHINPNERADPRNLFFVTENYADNTRSTKINPTFAAAFSSSVFNNVNKISAETNLVEKYWKYTQNSYVGPASTSISVSDNALNAYISSQKPKCPSWDKKIFNRNDLSFYPFVIDETTSTSTNLGVFLPFFVLTKTTPISDTEVEYETYMNGEKVFDFRLNTRLDYGNNYDDYFFGFTNGSTETTNPTRMFLFDYYYSYALNTNLRDLYADQILNYLVYKNKFLITRSSDPLQLRYREDQTNGLGLSEIYYPFFNVVTNWLNDPRFT